MNNAELRQQYPEFIYDSFKINRLADGFHVEYNYILGEHTFKPQVFIPISDIKNEWINDDFIEHLFFNFGIINAINYYKLTISPRFIIRAGKLDNDQKAFFKKLFYNGLGEFLYVNQLNITYDDFLEIVADTPAEKPEFRIGDDFHGNLIPVGGGKDSIVTLEALQPMHDENICFQYNRSIYPENRAAIDSIKFAGYPLSSSVNFNLTLDEKLLELNKQGFYNGHIPFSSCLAFASVIMAYLTNRAHIVLSNEASANEGNIPGTNINHQYSKSFEFEQDFRWYLSTYITDKIDYFSLLRCLNEYEIVQKFLKNRKYLNIFRSCNVGTHLNKWCAACAKCLYVYIMLYPFVERAELINIFGYDMFQNPNLLQIFIGLYNPDSTKPFECVGTKEEINYCLKLALENYDHNIPLPYLLQYYQTYAYNPNATYNVVNYFNPQHAIPQDYLNLITKL